MKIKTNRILTRWIVAAVAFLASATGLAGCSSGADADEPEAGVDGMMVTFRVLVPAAESGSRADGSAPVTGDNAQHWGDYTGVEGTAFESALLVKKFAATLYNSADGSLLGNVRFLALGSTAVSGGATVYTFNGYVDFVDPSMTEEQLQEITAKLSVTANADPTDAQFAVALGADGGLGALTFNRFGTQADVEAIPMWGVATKKLSGIKRGVAIDFGEVTLLRAMAKVEIDFNRDKTGDTHELVIEEVEFSRVNPTGYVLPGGWSSVSETNDIRLDATMRVPEQTAPGRTFSHGKKDEPIVLYIPEMYNSEGNDEIVMTVRYKPATGDSNGSEGRILFRPYNGEDGTQPTGEPWNIVRNHYYKFEITKIGNFYLQFRVRMLPWAEADDQEVQLPK